MAPLIWLIYYLCANIGINVVLLRCGSIALFIARAKAAILAITAAHSIAPIDRQRSLATVAATFPTNCTDTPSLIVRLVDLLQLLPNWIVFMPSRLIVPVLCEYVNSS